MMRWYDNDGGSFVWLPMTLGMLAFWGVLVVGGLALYRILRRDDVARAGHQSDARRLLDERFARGEIDADEYAQRRDLLQSGR